MGYHDWVKDLKRSINALQGDIKNLSDDEKSWTPNPEQSRIGTKLAKCIIAYLIPFSPADSSLQPINRQSSMDVRHLACLLMIENGVLRKRQGRAIRHLVENIGHYQPHPNCCWCATQ